MALSLPYCCSLQEMRHFGLLSGMRQRLVARLLLATQSTEPNKLSVDLKDIAPIFVVLAIGIAASVALLLAEICHGAWSPRM